MNLTSLAGLESLATVGGSFWVQQNEALTLPLLIGLIALAFELTFSATVAVRVP